MATASHTKAGPIKSSLATMKADTVSMASARHPAGTAANLSGVFFSNEIREAMRTTQFAVQKGLATTRAAENSAAMFETTLASSLMAVATIRPKCAGMDLVDWSHAGTRAAEGKEIETPVPAFAVAMINRSAMAAPAWRTRIADLTPTALEAAFALRDRAARKSMPS